MPCLLASQVTNHDVKAVEYFLKRKFDGLGLGRHKEFIHFALTSQDVNHVALPLMLRDALEHIYCPALRSLVGDPRRFRFAVGSRMPYPETGVTGVETPCGRPVSARPAF